MLTGADVPSPWRQLWADTVALLLCSGISTKGGRECARLRCSVERRRCRRVSAEPPGVEAVASVVQVLMLSPTAGRPTERRSMCVAEKCELAGGVPRRVMGGKTMSCSLRVRSAEACGLGELCALRLRIAATLAECAACAVMYDDHDGRSVSLPTAQSVLDSLLHSVLGTVAGRGDRVHGVTGVHGVAEAHAGDDIALGQDDTAVAAAAVTGSGASAEEASDALWEYGVGDDSSNTGSSGWPGARIATAAEITGTRLGAVATASSAEASVSGASMETDSSTSAVGSLGGVGGGAAAAYGVT